MDVKETSDERGNPVFEVSSPKTKTTYKVQKTNNGFAMFDIRVSDAKKPKELEGSWTTPEKALKHLEAYLKVKKETKLVRRDNNIKAREEQKNAKAILSDPADNL